MNRHDVGADEELVQAHPWPARFATRAGPLAPREHPFYPAEPPADATVIGIVDHWDLE